MECRVYLTTLGPFRLDIVCVVRPIPSGSSSKPQSYRVSIAVKDGVCNFSPMDFPAILQRDNASRDLFLLKRKDLVGLWMF